MIRFALPFPPPLNSLFRNVSRKDGKKGGRIVTERYERWRKEAAEQLFGGHLGRVEGGFRITFEYERPDRRRRDLDGLVKAPLDWLVKAACVEDDSLAQEIVLRWLPGEPVGKGAVVWVEIEPCAADR